MEIDGVNKWFEAARHDDVEFLRGHVDTYTNSRDTQGYTALMHAAEAESMKAVKFLASYEAGRVNNDGYTALALAVMSDVRLACVMLYDLESRIILPKNMSPLMVAVSASAVECTEFLATYYAEEVDDHGRGVLDYAAAQGSLEVTKILLSRVQNIEAEKLCRAITVARDTCNEAQASFLQAALAKKRKEEVACQKCATLQAYIAALERENRKVSLENARYEKELECKNREIERLKLTVNSLLLETDMRKIFAIEDEASAAKWSGKYRRRRKTLNTKLIKADLFNIADVEINTAAFLDYITYVAEFYKFPTLLSTINTFVEENELVRSPPQTILNLNVPYARTILTEAAKTLIKIRDSAGAIYTGMKNLETIIDSQLSLRGLLERRLIDKSSLMDAVHARDLEKMRQSMLHVGLRDASGKTALMHAAISGWKDAVLILAPLEAGQRDMHGNMAIDHCLKNGRLEEAAVILPYDYPDYEKLPLECSQYNKTSLMCAAEAGRLLDCFCYIKLGMAGRADYRQQTALMFGAEAGQEEVVKLLIPHEVALRDSEGRTALYYAACNGHLGCVKLLAAREARIPRPDTRWTALMISAYNGHTACVEELQSTEAGMRAADSCTALMLAAQNGHAGCVQALIHAEGRMTTTSAYYRGEGCTALMMAAFCGQQECVEILLPVEYNIEKETPDSDTKSTVLDYACIPDKCVSAEVRESIVSTVEKFLRLSIVS